MNQIDQIAPEPQPQVKICRRCKIPKPVSDFYRDNRRPGKTNAAASNASFENA
jgi:hypothetical protein